MITEDINCAAARLSRPSPSYRPGDAGDAVQILAAMSHDLQSPITRMQLRAEQMEDIEQRRKLQRDLDEMVVLVKEGLSYARSLHETNETTRMLDLDALLDAVRCDREDAGDRLRVTGRVGRSVCARPLALRRIITNLVDNAFKYGCEVEITVVERNANIEVRVLDKGPGLPESELDAAFLPFYRVQDPERPCIKGSGLGLAIAKRLACSFGAQLSLSNRLNGGLIAKFSMPASQPLDS